MAVVRLVSLVCNASAPNELAQFWARALRWNIRETDRAGRELVPADATSFSLLFRPQVSNKVGQNRIHFDLTTTSLDDQKETVTELLARGATYVDIGQNPNDTHEVLADPEGNELCIIDSDNRFLASCPRLGAVNCDGTRALGCFWSEALGWPLVWDENDETAIQAPNGTGPKITWSGPPLMAKLGEERFHFHVAPTPKSSLHSALDHLLALGSTRVHFGPGCSDVTTLVDVDGNHFCLETSRLSSTR
jgi:hypothetical protein